MWKGIIDEKDIVYSCSRSAFGQSNGWIKAFTANIFTRVKESTFTALKKITQRQLNSRLILLF